MNERISLETRGTHAHWRVTYHSTLSIGVARTRARVAALLVDAGQASGAFAVADALRLAVGWRSKELGQARAGWRVVPHLTLTVRATGRWDAWVLLDWRFCLCEMVSATIIRLESTLEVY